MIRSILTAIALVALLGQPVYAALKPSADVVDFRAVEPQDKYHAGDSFRILFELAFEDNWHGQAHNPTIKGLIPTKLTLSSQDGISQGRISYPPGKLVKFDFAKEPLLVYDGITYLGTTIALPPDIKPGEYPLEARLTVQACDDKACLMPSDIVITVMFNVVPSSEPVAKINQDKFKSARSLFETWPETPGTGGLATDIADYLSDNGLFLTFIFIFIGGLALNLTPCVYPLIPITVSYFGGKSESKKGGLIVNAFLYLFGMAVMYSTLGLFAALTGSMFGDILRQPAAIVVIAAILVSLALSMFGLFELRPPLFLTRIGGKNREGAVGTFLMGLTVGIIAAPCIGPFVVGLLAFVGERGDPLLGFTMFFVLALGLGAPFVFLAIFSGAISIIPSSGMWMVWVKKVFGVILLGMALYFLEALIPQDVYPYAIGVFLIVAGVYLGWIAKAQTKSSGFKMLRLVVGLAFTGVGLFFLAPANSGEGPVIGWENATGQALEKSLSTGRPVIIDFSADWCLPCKELEHFTFTDERVIAYSEKIEMLFADLTTTGNPEVEPIKKKFNVVGVPTIVFLDETGQERLDLRFVGFVDADEFLSKMKALTK